MVNAYFRWEERLMATFEEPRTIEERELPELIGLLNLVFRPKGGDMGRDYPRHVALNNIDNVRIIKQNGKIVSHVSTSIRPLSLGGISTWEAGIGAVATHPGARGQGFASILMNDSVKRSVEQGADLMFISGDNGVYRGMHAVECGRFPVVKIGKDTPKTNPIFILSEAKESDVDAICRLWETLPTRYLLPREDWAALLQCKLVMDKPSDWWTVRFGDDLLGFGIVHRKESEMLLLDWAGHPDALDAAAAFWFGRYGVESITYVPSSLSLLPMAWRTCIQQIRAFDGTLLVIEAQRFLHRAESFFIEKIGEEAFRRLRIEAKTQWALFEWEGERAEFEHGGELAFLFFGHPTEDIISKKVPAGSALHSLLKRMFPVPLVWYGIGYV